MRVSKATAALAGRYTRITYPGWVLNIQGMAANTFLKAQETTCPQMLCNLA